MSVASFHFNTTEYYTRLTQPLTDQEDCQQTILQQYTFFTDKLTQVQNKLDTLRHDLSNSIRAIHKDEWSFTASKKADDTWSDWIDDDYVFCQRKKQVYCNALDKVSAGNDIGCFDKHKTI
ncbi:hypothetical protein CU098_008568 [Rhizopus stolonifer]|uniref:Uncharacterized protein n=1 Tax=Rhizopus stolonifer TaxID=4846 RepID=A0A367IYU8_RHIST|nr:hypothetical protein CU098_008568 [Rhizopus stolonifer]